jgi:hypothetical protein
MSWVKRLFVVRGNGGDTKIEALPDPFTMKSIEYFPNGQVALITFRDEISPELVAAYLEDYSRGVHVAGKMDVLR